MNGKTTADKLKMPGTTEPPRNLWEQMTRDAKTALAALLGFMIDNDELTGDMARSFKLRMEEIDCLPVGFTVGDALQAYFDSLRRTFPDHRPQADPASAFRLIGWLPPLRHNQVYGITDATTLELFPSETQAVSQTDSPVNGKAVAVYVRRDA